MGAAKHRQSNSFSWPIWHHARPRERNFGGFLDDEVLKLFLETVIIAILGQQAADFA